MRLDESGQKSFSLRIKELESIFEPASLHTSVVFVYKEKTDGQSRQRGVIGGPEDTVKNRKR